MLSFLPPIARAAVAILLLVVNTLFWCALLFALALVKLLLPFAGVRTAIDPLLNGIATRWIAGNSAWMRLTQRTVWDVAGLEGLEYRGWYMVSANHQTWVDIFVLQHLLNRRIPLLKFFLKHELIYVPVMGLAWWALDFPFMRRHSDRYLRKHPEKRLQDLETTRRACAKFARLPTSVMNFVEGTRFTAAKHAAQRSPYRHLLKPKAGALALSLNALGDRFDSMLDATIVYPEGAPSFWQFLRGDVRRVVVRIDRHPIPREFCTGDFMSDSKLRKRVQAWLHELWQRKDARIDAVLSRSETGGASAAPGTTADFRAGADARSDAGGTVDARDGVS
ncbi:MAG: acyltransferase [Burkholderiaceae bacterium]|nr:acyltransferase [Burkholderiaceae bacterium]